MDLIKTILDIFHLLGLALSFGLVLFCDYLLISLITQGKFNEFQYAVLQRCSHVIVLALQMLILSGLGYLFYYIFDGKIHLLSNPKLIAKECVVLVLCINGFWLHQYGLAIFKQNSGQSFHQDSKLGLFRKITMMGMVSSISWWTAFVLGTAKILNFKFATEVFLAVYFLAISTSLLAVEVYIFYLKKKNALQAQASNKEKTFELTVSELNFIENVKPDTRPDGEIIDRGAEPRL